jgi:hypothetical protein
LRSLEGDHKKPKLHFYRPPPLSSSFVLVFRPKRRVT